MDQTQPSPHLASFAIGLVMLVVGAGAAFGITHAVDRNNTNKQVLAAQETSATKAADLRASLVTLGVEHMDLTDAAIDAALDGDANASAVANDLFANGDQIGAAVGSIYGSDAQSTFDTVWKLHLNDFVKYAVASKSGDMAGKAAQLADIQANYIKPLSQYLAKANPNLSESGLEGLLQDHVDMTAQMIDDHVKGDYAGEASLRGQGADHLNALFSALAGAIVKQYPSKF
jgi:hypothetical protein